VSGFPLIISEVLLYILSQFKKAIRRFKDEYLLDYINVEDIDAREKDVDERLVEQRIIHNIKRFIMTLGRVNGYDEVR
jgi:hypothetical protein